MNPLLLDMYSLCKACSFSLRAASHLRKRFENVKPIHPLEILFATYGDPRDPMSARDVTTALHNMALDSYWMHDRLIIKSSFKLDVIFGFDPAPGPAPGQVKQLRIRYRMQSTGIQASIGSLTCTYGNLILGVLPENKLPSMVVLKRPDARYLHIRKATWGHPKGKSSDGRMSIDVTEIVQGFVDLLGGSYLDISALTPLNTLFSDPCPGYLKDLCVEYDISGRARNTVREECRGHLKKRIFIEESPTVAPLLFITQATYGVTPIGRKERLMTIEKELQAIQIIKHRLEMGMQMQPEDVKTLSQEANIREERDVFRSVACNFVDVRAKLQRLADSGITSLHLNKDSFDPNAVFGNPTKGVKKILEVSITCSGHDSERYTDSKEMTESGYSRNFITSKSNRYLIVVNDDPITGNGVMRESLDFATHYTSPVILITNAAYGDFSDMKKVIDVTPDIQRLVTGGILCIERTFNLNSYFQQDPCPGTI